MTKFVGLPFLLFVLAARIAQASVMPNPDVSAPLAVSWWLEVIILLLLSVWPGFVLILVTRAFNKKADADKSQNNRIQAAENELNGFKLQSAERDREHDKKIHELELKLRDCREKSGASRGLLITRTEHHGDVMALQNRIAESYDKLMAAVQEIHRRIDEVVQKKNSSEAT